MSGAFRVFRAEIARLMTSRVAWLGAFLLVAVTILRIWAAEIAQRAREVEAIASGREVIGITSGTGWSMLADGWRAGMALATVLLLVQSARSVAGDRETGVFRLAVTRSASRAGAVVGRALVGPFLTLTMIALSGVSAFAATKLFGGDFGDLTEQDYVFWTALEMRQEFFRALQPIFLGMAAMHSFGLFVSSLARGPVLALAGSLALVLVWDVFKEDTGEYQYFVFASHAPTFADSSAMSEMKSFTRGMSDANIPDAVFNMGRVLSPAEAIVLVLLACLVIQNRPI